MKMLSLITYHMSFQILKSFVRPFVLDEKREACDCPIDCQIKYIVKAQKSMKDIIKTVHLPSVV